MRENHISKSRSPSPVCMGPRGGRTRQNNEVSNYLGSRRSNRTRGIPASEADPENAECNGSGPPEEEEEEEASLCDLEDVTHSQLCLPLKKRRIAPLEENHIKAEVNADAKKKFRTLLMESERFLHYPSRNSCRMRSTVNSAPPAEPPAEPEAPEAAPETAEDSSLPHVVDDVEFSFEIVPSGTTWFQTFLRDELQGNDPLPECIPDRPAPFLLPYEMSLESILKSQRAIRTKKKPPAPTFRPIISTRLQMQSAAKQSKVAAAELRSASRAGRRKCALTRMPRKSPRCHASTMAILCSNSDSGSVADVVTSVAEEQPEEEESEVDDRCKMEKVLDQVLKQGLPDGRYDSTAHERRRRGRPRKHPLPSERMPKANPLAELIATPLERIDDIVDERIIGIQPPDAVSLFSDDDDELVLHLDGVSHPPEANSAGLLPAEVFHDVEGERSEVGSSSSVYETASDMSSTSTTGTCDSRRRKQWRRRKRPNMTGWPRSKKRKAAAPLFMDLSESETLSSSEDPVTPHNGLGTIHEESGSSKDSSPLTSPVETAGNSSPRRMANANGWPGKPTPFHFQRKSLKFVGKRILRPAAQRHAPQRLEYWPCFHRQRAKRK